MSSKYSTKQCISAQYCGKQMSESWCKNIQAFLRYSNFRVGIFYFASPCILKHLSPSGRPTILVFGYEILGRNSPTRYLDVYVFYKICCLQRNRATLYTGYCHEPPYRLELTEHNNFQTTQSIARPLCDS